VVIKEESILKKNKGYIITFAIGLLMFTLGSAEESYAFESAKFAIRELCGHMMGNLGALLMTTAGVGAIVSAAFGNFKASYSLIITGVGAFAISSMLRFYFPAAANECDSGGGGGAIANRTISQEINAAAQSNFAGNNAAPISNAPAIAIATDQTADFSKAAKPVLSEPEEKQGAKTAEDPDDMDPGNAKNLVEMMDSF
jgi:hypothetical protein